MHTAAILQSKEVMYAVSKGLPQQAFDLAKSHIESGTATTVEVVNSILANFGWSISKEELDVLLSLPKVAVPLPLQNNPKASAIIGRDLPTDHPDHALNQFTGVYMFSYGDNLYVGSSIYLGRRVRQYFRPSLLSRENRPVVKALHGPEGNKYTLHVIIIPTSLASNPNDILRLVRVLEQYYLLAMHSTLNVLKVAGANPISVLTQATKDKIRAKAVAAIDPVYIYSLDGTILYYVADSIRGLYKDIDNIVYRARLTECVNKGIPLYGQYTLSRTTNTEAKPELVTLEELQVLLEGGKKYEASFKTAKDFTHSAVKIRCIDTLTGTIHVAPSIASACEYTRNYKPDSTRLVGYIKIAKMTPTDVYKGWRFEHVHFT